MLHRAFVAKLMRRVAAAKANAEVSSCLVLCELAAPFNRHDASKFGHDLNSTRESQQMRHLHAMLLVRFDVYATFTSRVPYTILRGTPNQTRLWLFDRGRET